MKSLYSAPLRVYLFFTLIAILGIYAGFNLPISLYPNSTKPTIRAGVSYGSYSTNEFLETFGKNIEYRIKSLDIDGRTISKIKATYRSTHVSYNIEFPWGVDPKKARNEVSNILNAQAASWPQEIRDSLWVNFWSDTSGFVAVSFFSDKRDVEELYNIIDPIITPKLSKIKDTDEIGLWNPSRKEVRIILDPYAMSSLGLFPKDIEKVLDRNLVGRRGGYLKVGQNHFNVQMPRTINDLKDLSQMLITLKSGKMIHLSEVAHIEYGKVEGHNKIIKTNGATSLILYGSPRAGGNVKKLGEDVLKIVRETIKEAPKDIQYRVLVDPSSFIKQSVNNVIHEVLLAAFLAVGVLFIFIGSLKNTITTAIEIPISMVMAFILMKMTNMNINLISLGGLALAAGMNVDASIVILENIFRHMEISKPIDFSGKLKTVVGAVKEVRLAIIASTISTLVVFIPLAFTRDLTNAILGDLAKAIVFSHGFSMFIALILVPTIRLQILSREKSTFTKPKAVIDPVMKYMENIHASFLSKLMSSAKIKWGILSAFIICVVLSVLIIVPTLKKEIIGKPDTDWLILSVSTFGNTQVKQMETISDEVEDAFLKEFGKYVAYTFVQIRNPNRTTIMARLKNKKDMKLVWEKMEEKYQNTSTLFYWVGPWNPAELPLPNPPHYLVEIKGGAVDDQKIFARELTLQMKQNDFFPKVWSEPGVSFRDDITLVPNLNLWPALYKQNVFFTPSDLIDLARVATQGKEINTMPIDGQSTRIFMKFPNQFISSKENLEAYPIKVGEKVIPLKALANISIETAPPMIYREDSRNVILVMAKQNQGKDHLIEGSKNKLTAFLNEFKKKKHQKLEMKTRPSIVIKDADHELNNALNQLGISVGLSIILILFTLFMQFGNFTHSLIIMVAIPSGVLGGTLSLWAFGSTLSLNSVLGIILLNGIAVNNSIILVDFIRKLHNGGMNSREAVLVATRKRMKPILITSLTTILGMLPVALGLGEGGKILRPLGIAVSGGLLLSTLFTLFLVPLLESMYLSNREQREFNKINKGQNEISEASI